jgi:hypothetical protein
MVDQNSSAVDWEAYGSDPIYRQQVIDWWRQNNAYYYQLWNNLAGYGHRSRSACEPVSSKPPVCKKRRKAFCNRFEALYKDKYTKGDCRTMGKSELKRLTKRALGKTSTMKDLVKEMSKQTCI